MSYAGMVFIQVENKGPSNISEAEVYILWPSMRETEAPLLYLTAQPQLDGAGRCQYVSDVNVYNLKVSQPHEYPGACRGVI